ncbi:MAG: hypothetical protein ACRC7S_08780 [Cetobacterium sp.]
MIFDRKEDSEMKVHKPTRPYPKTTLHNLEKCKEHFKNEIGDRDISETMKQVIVFHIELYLKSYDGSLDGLIDNVIKRVGCSGYIATIVINNYFYYKFNK